MTGYVWQDITGFAVVPTFVTTIRPSLVGSIMRLAAGYKLTLIVRIKKYK